MKRNEQTAEFRRKFREIMDMFIKVDTEIKDMANKNEMKVENY
jgi:hypothetical protein